MTEQNKMRNISIEKVVLNVGGTGDNLEKGYKLIERISGKKPMKTKSKKRIPTWGVRPGLEVGAVVTVRREYKDLLKRLLVAIEKTIRKKQVTGNFLSFGLKEYLEIPGMEYQRDIGIMGLDVTVVFKRNGRRVSLRKIKRNSIPARQVITKEEIIQFMEKNYGVIFR